ncbi:MAG: hypothetical protein QOH59_2885, partial [Gemmatimonadales bacterium]|nr:hypothetical protein [Gemmatimonadales bacterium]
WRHSRRLKPGERLHDTQGIQESCAFLEHVGSVAGFCQEAEMVNRYGPEISVAGSLSLHRVVVGVVVVTVL